MNNTKLLLSVIAAGVLSACGGGSGGGSGATVSGYVLDGKVESSRVCYDKNEDNQCTSADGYVTTNEEGYFEITQQTEYQLIADVRYQEASDSDYASGTPDYDYVMHAFDQSRDEVVISPLSTYLNYETTVGGKSKAQALHNTVSLIESYEEYEYTEEVEVEYEYTEIIQSNYIQGKESNDGHLADYSSRIHNINEVLAREMQESQAVWEDRFYDGNLYLEDSSWSSNSDTVVSNSHYTAFESFETIVEEVTQYEYSSFSAETVSDSLWMDVPGTDQIQDLIDYMETELRISEEFSGSTYMHTITSLYSTIRAYYVFSSQGISYYAQTGDYCVFASSPFNSSISAGWSESQFVSEMNKAFDQVNGAGYGITYSDLVKTSAPPANCSSLSDLLDDFNTTTSLDNSSDGAIYKPNYPCIGTVDSEGTCKPPAPIIASNKTVQKSDTISSGGSNMAPATISTCGKPGVIYAMSPCNRPSRKD